MQIRLHRQVSLVLTVGLIESADWALACAKRAWITTGVIRLSRYAATLQLFMEGVTSHLAHGPCRWTSKQALVLITLFFSWYILNLGLQLTIISDFCFGFNSHYVFKLDPKTSQISFWPTNSKRLPFLSSVMTNWGCCKPPLLYIFSWKKTRKNIFADLVHIFHLTVN